MNPVPGGGTSGAATFTINNPTPVVTSATPSSILAGSAATTVSITGTGFVASSVVQWNDAARTATFVSSTQLQIGLTASDLATGGSATLTVINPGAAASRCVDFTIN